MKQKNLIPFVVIIGMIILYFFPEPEENFLVYLGIILFFIFVIIFLIRKGKRFKLNFLRKVRR